ncbi:MAG TPA: hypothetical protein VFE17_06800 [Candidatus Baltobacteraceae bacterium]|jgi:hypothetical protein|nr:hypothetical protein [Candidatus Baltobacteraceae bacterium]
MAEIFGNGGETVPVSGYYECSDCGHREHFTRGSTFPPDHHPEKPWTLYQATEELPAGQTTNS